MSKAVFVILYQALKSDGGGPQITAVSSEEESEEEEQDEEDEEGIVEQGKLIQLCKSVVHYLSLILLCLSP